MNEEPKFEAEMSEAEILQLMMFDMVRNNFSNANAHPKGIEMGDSQPSKIEFGVLSS